MVNFLKGVKWNEVLTSTISVKLVRKAWLPANTGIQKSALKLVRIGFCAVALPKASISTKMGNRYVARFIKLWVYLPFYSKKPKRFTARQIF